MEDPLQRINDLLLKHKKLSLNSTSLIEFSLLLSSTLKQPNSDPSLVLEILQDFLQFISSNSIEKSILQEIFNSLSLEYSLHLFISNNLESFPLLLKIFTFISTNSHIRPFFSYDKLWNSLQVRGMQERIFQFNTTDPSASSLFDQLHLIWEFRKADIPYSVVSYSLVSFKTLLFSQSDCKIRSIILHILLSWWDNFLPKDSFDFDQFIPSNWTCKTCKYCKIVFENLLKAIYFHLNSPFQSNDKLVLFLCKLALEIEHWSILKWAWNKIEIENVYWNFFILHPTLPPKFLSPSSTGSNSLVSFENDFHFFICLYFLIQLKNDFYLTICSNNVFNLKNISLISRFFQKYSLSSTSSIKYSSKRWMNLLVGLARNESFCNEFIKFNWNEFRGIIETDLDVMKVQLLRLLFEFPLNRYRLIQLEGQHLVIDLLVKIKEQEIENEQLNNNNEMIKLLFNCLFNVQFITNALESINNERLSLLIALYFSTHIYDSLALLKCLSSNKLKQLDEGVYEQLCEFYFSPLDQQQVEREQTFKLIKLIDNYFVGMKFLQKKFYKVPSDYQKYFAQFFSSTDYRWIRGICCERDERVFIQHKALFTSCDYWANGKSKEQFSGWNEEPEFVEFISSSSSSPNSSIMLDKKRLIHSKFFSFLFSSFPPPYKLNENEQVLKNFSSLLSNSLAAPIDDASLDSFVALLRFTNKYCLDELSEQLEGDIFDFHDPLLIAKRIDFFFTKRFERLLAVRLLQGTIQYCELGEESIINWAIERLNN